jgi:hypothetical protein
MYTGILLVSSSLLNSVLLGKVAVVALAGNIMLWASFCLVISFLDKNAEKNKDDAYLYYLGVSGLRMLVYMAALGLAVYFSPPLRDRTMVLLLTTSFLMYTVVEVSSFVRKLREIFRS